MNTKPTPRKIQSKVARTTGGGSATSGLHSAGAGNLKVGKKHSAKNDAGNLSVGSSARKGGANRMS